VLRLLARLPGLMVEMTVVASWMTWLSEVEMPWLPAVVVLSPFVIHAVQSGILHRSVVCHLRGSNGGAV
jgi:hypothetical protein